MKNLTIKLLVLLVTFASSCNKNDSILIEYTRKFEKQPIEFIKNKHNAVHKNLKDLGFKDYAEEYEILIDVKDIEGSPFATEFRTAYFLGVSYTQSYDISEDIENINAGICFVVGLSSDIKKKHKEYIEPKQFTFLSDLHGKDTLKNYIQMQLAEYNFKINEPLRNAIVECNISEVEKIFEANKKIDLNFKSERTMNLSHHYSIKELARHNLENPIKKIRAEKIINLLEIYESWQQKP